MQVSHSASAATLFSGLYMVKMPDNSRNKEKALQKFNTIFSENLFSGLTNKCVLSGALDIQIDEALPSSADVVVIAVSPNSEQGDKSKFSKAIETPLLNKIKAILTQSDINTENLFLNQDPDCISFATPEEIEEAQSQYSVSFDTSLYYTPSRLLSNAINKNSSLSFPVHITGHKGKIVDIDPQNNPFKMK